jgi:hypothetical protein
MEEIDAVIMELVEECHDDYVGLWVVMEEVRHLVGQERLVERTLTVIRSLLEQGIIAGQFYDHDFRQWQMPNDQIVDKIKKDWAELGHEPTGGDVVWLTSKDDS